MGLWRSPREARTRSYCHVSAVFSADIDCNRNMAISKVVFSDLLLYKAPLERVQKLPLLKCAYSMAAEITAEIVAESSYLTE